MRPIALALLGLALSTGAYAQDKRPVEERPGIQLAKLKAPSGYRVSVIARDVPKARAMALAPDGTLFVGSSEGNVYVVKLNGAEAAPARTVVTGMKSSGIAYANGSLFVSDRDRILRYDDMPSLLAGTATPKTILTGLPDEKRHSARFMAVGSDGKLYISVGSPCNVCEPTNDNYGTIIRVAPDGTGREVVARGIRNTVGFDWNPRDGALWFTDNGQDDLGTARPEDELNRVSMAGEHFGFPYCHAGTIADPEFGKKRSCTEFTAPALGLGAHTAALGMRFVKSDGSALIARHGSHPPTLVAYDVVRVKIDGGRAAKTPEPFLTGFLQGRQYWGRPADVLPMDDGSVLVTDDLNGAIYRVAKAPDLAAKP